MPLNVFGSIIRVYSPIIGYYSFTVLQICVYFINMIINYDGSIIRKIDNVVFTNLALF